MFYYDLLVNSTRFSDGFFSYRSPVQLKPNQVVRVPFGQKDCLALVSNPAPPSSRQRPLKAVGPAGGRLPVELVTAASRLAQRDNLATSELAQLLLSNASLSGRTDSWPSRNKTPKVDRTLTKSQAEVYEQIKSQKPGATPAPQRYNRLRQNPDLHPAGQRLPSGWPLLPDIGPRNRTQPAGCF